MHFCPKCGTRLRPRQDEESKQPKLLCEKCGYSTAVLATSRPEGASIPRTEKASIKVLGDDTDDIEPLPTARADCPKCGHDTAVWWMVQTRGGDEPTTQFYRCVKCSHTWRHYG